MGSIYSHKAGGWYLREKTSSGRLAQIYLGKITKNLASEVLANVENLSRGNRLNIPNESAIEWALGTEEKLQKKLREHGFLRVAAPQEWTVEDWITRCIEKSTGKGSTKRGLVTAKRHWVRLLCNKRLHLVTTGDCREGVDHLNSTCSAMHANRISERGKMFFQFAVDHKLLKVNPFAGIKFAMRRIDKTRQRYISQQQFHDVCEMARHQEAKVLFLFARYGGLRVPSEPLALTWSDVDWGKQRLSIPNETKTGFRVLPIFPQFASDLWILFNQAPDHATHIFRHARGSAGTEWARWLKEAVLKSHQSQWPKLWVNLRASCRTDLEDRFPSQVCDAWLGHSTKVAKDHYLLVKPEHWQEAMRTAKSDSAQHGAQQTNRTDVV